MTVALLKRLAAMIVLLMLSLLPTQAQTSYTMHTFTTLAGIGDPSAVWMNNSGQVCGTSQASGGASHPVRWDPNFSTKVYAVTDLGLLSGTSSGSATWINDNGDVVGYAPITGSMYSYYKAFLHHSGTLSDITPSGWVSATARCVTNNGVVVGYGCKTSYADPWEFWYNISTGAYTTRQLTWPESGLVRANDAGYALESGNTDVRTTSTSFTLPATPDSNTFIPIDISPLGHVMGYTKNSSNVFQHTYVWRPKSPNNTSGWFEEIGFSGYKLTGPKHLNIFGDIVGNGTINSSGNAFAYLIRYGKLNDLNNLKPSSFTGYIRGAYVVNDHHAILIEASGSYLFAVMYPDP